MGSVAPNGDPTVVVRQWIVTRLSLEHMRFRMFGSIGWI